MSKLPAQHLAPCTIDTYNSNIHRVCERKKMEPEPKQGRRTRRAVARDFEPEENSQRVILTDEEPQDSDDCRRRKVGTSKSVEFDDGDIDGDPFMSAVKLQNSKMKRSQKRYEYMDDVIRAPSIDWTGKDLPSDVELTSPKFWSPNYTYEINNLRLRRSKYNKTQYIHVLKSQDSRDPQRLSFSSAIIPQIVQILKDLQHEIEAQAK